MSNPIATSSWALDSYVLPEGLLATGSTYFWRVSAEGPDNYDGTQVSATSPIWSFIATADPSLTTTPDSTSSSSSSSTSAKTSASASRGGIGQKPSCTAVVIIDVRGSNAPAGKLVKQSDNVYKFGTGGYGDVILNDLGGLANIKGLSVSTEALHYPATIVGPAYSISADTGGSNLRGAMNDVANTCPNSKIWLVGHSQGADVISRALRYYSLLNKTAKANFNGAVLFGNPTYRANELIDAAGNGPNNGVFWQYRANKALDGITRNNVYGVSDVNAVKSFCYKNDKYCQNGQSLDVHNSYGNRTTVGHVVPFLKQFVTK
nr:cutinase family protein [Frondihabitans sp. VKM Ac-2883]